MRDQKNYYNFWEEEYQIKKKLLEWRPRTNRPLEHPCWMGDIK